jgi:hypothetical protein
MQISKPQMGMHSPSILLHHPPIKYNNYNRTCSILTPSKPKWIINNVLPTQVPLPGSCLEYVLTRADDSDAFLEELDDLARVGARPAQVTNNHPSVKRNESPQGLNVPHMSTASEIDFGDLGQDFLDTPGNSSVISS